MATTAERCLYEKTKRLSAILERLNIEEDAEGNTVINVDGHPIVAVVPSEEAIKLRAFEQERRTAIGQ